MTVAFTISPSFLSATAIVLALLFNVGVIARWVTKVQKDREFEKWRRSPEQLVLQQLNSPWWARGEPLVLQRVGSEVSVYRAKPYGEREELELMAA